jgi:hypothetical protein
VSDIVAKRVLEIHHGLGLDRRDHGYRWDGGTIDDTGRFLMEDDLPWIGNSLIQLLNGLDTNHGNERYTRHSDLCRCSSISNGRGQIEAMAL